MGTVDDYLQTLDEPTREAYAHVLALAVAEVPQARQGNSYGMAALTYRGRPLLGFKAASKHLSLFPFSSAAVSAVEDDLVGLTRSKGTLRFDASHPLPDTAVRALVRARADEIDGHTP